MPLGACNIEDMQQPVEVRLFILHQFESPRYPPFL